ncbi:hypothetical protein C5746_36815 [Streptomyces atratus]|uniref:Uncharacterized protein n=1 Tax=Streptomyces atratus TaxID=1893 RepID=A0A2Z5JMX5_STRAR|nr:hypothetical protein C5746_36815 [Streptomyces atratus]
MGGRVRSRWQHARYGDHSRTRRRHRHDRLWAGDLDPAAAEDDERAVCAGVSVAPYTCFSGE